jgi:hypothetical protein
MQTFWFGEPATLLMSFFKVNTAWGEFNLLSLCHEISAYKA